MSVSVLLIILLILLLLGVFPAWTYSREWGHGPAGIVTVFIIILLILLLTGRL